MLGKKIGNLEEVFSPDLNKYILNGLFDDEFEIRGKITDAQESFLVRITLSNVITMKRSQDKFVITLLYDDGIKPTNNMPKIIKATHTFAIYYFKEGFPVYNSEY